MKKQMSALAVTLGLVIGATLFATATSMAHESRDVADGQYNFVVGFLNEPAFQDELNAVSVRITAMDATATPAASGEEAEGTPVEGLAESLTFEVIHGDQTVEFEVRGMWGDPGHYVAYFIPTEPGDYSFHITGEIDGTPIDEMFTSGPETFSQVEPRSDYEFPPRES